MKLFSLLVAFVGARAYAVPEHQHAKYKGMEVPYSDPPVAEGEDPGVPYEDPYEEKEKQPTAPVTADQSPEESEHTAKAVLQLLANEDEREREKYKTDYYEEWKKSQLVEKGRPVGP